MDCFCLPLTFLQVFEPLLAKHCQPDLTLLHPPAKSHITTFLCCCLHHNSNHIPERTNTTRCQAQHRVSSIYNRSTWYSLNVFAYFWICTLLTMLSFRCFLLCYIKWWWLDIFMLSSFENWWCAVIFYEIYISSEGFMWMFPCTGPCNVDRKAELQQNTIRGDFFKQRDSFSDTDR